MDPGERIMALRGLVGWAILGLVLNSPVSVFRERAPALAYFPFGSDGLAVPSAGGLVTGRLVPA